MLFVAAFSVLCPAQQAGAEKNARASGDAAASSTGSSRREAVQKKKLESLLAPFDIKVGSMTAAAQSRTTATTYREVRVRWDDRTIASTDAQATTAQAATTTGASPVEMAVVGKRVHDGRLRLQRSTEMTPEQVLVVAVDAASELRWWTLIIDPRILRSETLLDDNQLRGHVTYRPSVEFFVEIPDDPEITELRFYKPTPGSSSSNRVALVLQPLGTISF